MTEMLKKAALATAMVLIVGLLAAAVYAAGADSPTFFVHEKTVELGEFYEGKDIEYEFTVRNNGVGELHINNVKPG